MRASVLRLGMVKEMRALLPTWLACTLAVGATAMADPRLLMIGVFAYAVGTIALGAQSIGHEYTYRTLGPLLSQPVDRRYLLLTKLGVLTLMLAALSAVTWGAVFSRTDVVRDSIWATPALCLLPVLCALFVAPAMTMACRNPLAGVVFTIVLPFCLLLVGEAVAIATYGWQAGSEVDSLKLVVFWRGIVMLFATAAIATWWLFMRLEASDAPGREIHLPRWRRGAPVAPSAARRDRHPMWLLVKKELRLQQMTFVVVGLYVLIGAGASILRPFFPEMANAPVAPLAVLHFGLLSILIGSLASAEERQFGTLEWQVLLPVPMWQQWSVKLAMTLGLAVGLGIGVPTLLSFISTRGADPRMVTQLLRETTVAIVVITSCSLYVSSLSSSGVRALVFAVPAGVAAVLYTRLAESVIWWIVRRSVTLSPPGVLPQGFGAAGRATFFSVNLYVSLAAATALVVLALRFAFVNHRSGERSVARTSRQVACMIGVLTVGLLLRVGVAAFLLRR